MSEIKLSKEKFLRASKKLNSILQSSHQLELKLSQTQELLSQSLGFKSHHALLEYCSAEPLSVLESQPRPQHTIVQFSYTGETAHNHQSPGHGVEPRVGQLGPITRVIDSQEQGQWLDTQSPGTIAKLILQFTALDLEHARAHSPNKLNLLVIPIIELLCTQRSTSPLTIARIKSSVTLANIVKIQKDKTQPAHILQKINDYLLTLPGYNSSQPALVQPLLEHHAPGQSTIYYALDMIETLLAHGHLLIVPKEMVINCCCADNKIFHWPQGKLSDFFNPEILQLIEDNLDERASNCEILHFKSAQEYFNLYSDYRLLDIIKLVDKIINPQRIQRVLQVVKNYVENIEHVQFYSKSLEQYVLELDHQSFIEALVRRCHKLPATSRAAPQ